MSAQTRPVLLHAMRQAVKTADRHSRYAELMAQAIAEIEELAAENVNLKAAIVAADRSKQ